MRPVFDTSVFHSYRHALTDADVALMALSMVVLYELTATTIDKATLKKYAAWRKTFAADNLLLTPTMSDWWETAKLVSRIRHRDKRENHGLTPPLSDATQLQNDALIARTAYLHHCFVVTANIKDFEQIQEFLPVRIVSARDYFGF